jgi:hypothetical protein
MQIPHQMDASSLNAALNAVRIAVPGAALAAQRAARGGENHQGFAEKT